MTDHADELIRPFLDGRYREGVEEAWAALDALLAENQREQHRAEIAEIALEDRAAENQRLRDAVQAFIAAGSNPRTPEYAALVREVQALAGDAE